MDVPVVVVGAGPSGLMLAGELGLAGVDVVVVECLERPTGESRGLGFAPRTMEVFQQRGLLDRFGDFVTSGDGHFGGIPVDFGLLDGAHFSVRDVPQSRTEAVLGEWLAELGVPIRRGGRLVGLAADEDGVTIEVSGPGGTDRLRCAYLVGCDGGHSTVRKLAGFDFPGTDSTMEMFLADVTGCEIRPRPIGESVSGGMAMAAPVGDVQRIIVCELGTPPKKRSGPPEFSEVADAWKRLTGQDISDATALWTSAFGNAARLVTQYRRGRVLLAGDAAHIHLPAGGQGMNVGIQDAVNLGWKLAAVVAGTATPDLLDTYHTERHPVGVRLLVNTQAQGLLYLSGSEMQPLRDVLSELVQYETVSRHLAGMVSGLDIRYDVGPGSHPLLGRRLAQEELVTGAGPTSTMAVLRGGRGVLLDLADDRQLRATARGWADRVDVVTARRQARIAADAVLARPDGYVAWAAPDAGGADLASALRRWFGPDAGISDAGH